MMRNGFMNRFPICRAIPISWQLCWYGALKKVQNMLYIDEWAFYEEPPIL